MDEPTPILRADATDDDLQEEKFATGGLVEGPKDPGDDSVPLFLDNGYVIPKSEGETPAEPAIVEEPKRLVPVVVSGVLHGYREE